MSAQRKRSRSLLRELRSVAVSGSLLLAVAVSLRAAPPYPGYTFFASGSKAYLVDMTGKTVHTWTASGSAQTCAYLLPDGSALFPIQNSSCSSPAHDGAYPHGRFQKIGWDGAILWDFRFCDSTARGGYDVEPMPNGNVMFPADSSSAAKIFEIQPSGTNGGSVVWSYTLPSAMTGSSTYINSVKYNPELDKIVVDLQDPQRKLVVIDHSGTAGVLFTNLVGASGRVHAANWVTKYHMGTTNVLPDADFAAMRTNNLLVVYNGGDKAVEVSMATSNQVRAFSYAFDDHEGSIQRLPNGNTLVTKGNSATITELDDTGATVATLTATANLQRAYRYGYAYPGVSRLVTNILTVVSAHGEPSPRGVSTNAYGALLTARISHSETNAGLTLFTNAGWTLSGVKATNGATTGTTTNLVFTMTNHATLTWFWATNYWLATNLVGNGSLGLSGTVPGWNPAGATGTLSATAAVGWRFAGWSGNTNGCAFTSTQIVAPMNQPRALTAVFLPLSPPQINLAVNATNPAMLWLQANDLPTGATATLLSTTDSANGAWQTGALFIVAAPATNWLIPAGGSNGFFRLRVQ